MHARAGSQARLVGPIRLGDKGESKVRGSLDEDHFFGDHAKPWFHLEMEGVILKGVP